MRAVLQQHLDVCVIVGKPPYSTGQDSATDDNANRAGPTVDASIGATTPPDGPRP